MFNRLTLQPEAELRAHVTTEAEVLSKILNQMHAMNFEAPAAPGGDKKSDAKPKEEKKGTDKPAGKPAEEKKGSDKPAGKPAEEKKAADGKPPGPKPGDEKKAGDGKAPGPKAGDAKAAEGAKKAEEEAK